MVKRKKFSNCDNPEEKCEEDCKPPEAAPSSNVTLKASAPTQLGETKDSIGTTLTRSKTALQLQQQSISNVTESVDPKESSQNEAKDANESESVNNISSSTNAKNTKPVVRTNKKSKKDLNGQSPVIQSSKKGKPILKPRRAWEVWSKQDIDLFFEGLCEYGKDFEKIQAFLVQRNKKKGVPIGFTKNKDQVRHFYYRALQKLTKHIVLEDSVNKLAQEVCIMVNYAELRRKLGRGLNQKNEQKFNEYIQKLNDLIYNGITTGKHRGRKIRIKTPVCRALKKLNNAEDSKFEETEKIPKLPSHIKVIFCPKNNATWAKIQTLSMNPRVKLKLSLQKRFSDIIEFLQRRWKPYRLKVKDRLLGGLPPSQQNINVKPSNPTEILKITPRIMPETDIHPVSITQTDASSSNQNFTLKDFISSPDACKIKKALKPKQITESKETSSSAAPPIEEPKSEADENDLKNLKSDKISLVPKDVCVAVANSDLNNGSEPSGINTVNDIENSALSNCELNLEAVKEGFTASSVVSLTVGQLFLMMNSPDTMILDYEWIPTEKSEPSAAKRLTYTLKELVQAASVSFTDISKIKQNAVLSGNVTACSCGHLCQQSSKNSHKASTVSRSPARGGNLMSRVYTTKQQICSKSSDIEDQDGSQKAVQNAKHETFLKPTAVAPRSTAQVSSRSPNFREQVVGISSLRRPNVRVRQLKKSLIGQRTLLPKAITTQQATPMVTVQLMPPANIPQVNHVDSIQKVAAQNPSKVLRILPGSKIVDISSVEVLNNISIPVTKTDNIQTNQNHISVNSEINSHQSIINTEDILSTITASIINDSESKQLESDPIISQAQVNKTLPTISAAENFVEISSNSPPRISIPDTNVSEQATNLPHNLSALLNTPLQNSGVSFINETQPHTLSSLINVHDDEARFDAVKTSTVSLEREQHVHSSSPEQLVHPSSPGLGTNWLDSENSEYSLSSLLGTLESPTKIGTPVLHSSVSMNSDNSSLDGIGRLAPDVDTQLQCLMNENSVDYVSKFADLAAHIASSDHKK